MSEKSSRKIPPTSHEMRERIVDLSFQGKTPAEISRSLLLNYKSIWSIIKKFNETKEVGVKKRGGDKPSKFTVDQKTELLSFVDQNCLLCISDLIEKVFVNFSIRVSASTIQRVLNDFHYFMKSIVAVPERRNDKRTLNLR